MMHASKSAVYWSFMVISIPPRAFASIPSCSTSHLGGGGGILLTPGAFPPPAAAAAAAGVVLCVPLGVCVLRAVTPHHAWRDAARASLSRMDQPLTTKVVPREKFGATTSMVKRQPWQRPIGAKRCSSGHERTNFSKSRERTGV